MEKEKEKDEQKDEINGLSYRAKENLRRNEFLRRRELGLEPIPTLRYSTPATFDAERVEPVREEVNGKWVLKFKYIVSAEFYDYDPGQYELTVDAKTSAEIDAYLSKGPAMLNVMTSRRGKDTKYKIQSM